MSDKRLTVGPSGNFLVRNRRWWLLWTMSGIAILLIVVVFIIQQAMKRKYEADIRHHREQVQQFYEFKVVPLTDAARQRNRESASRAIQFLHARFQAHHAGVKPFAEEVTGLGTKAAVVGLGARDLWERMWGRDGHFVKNNIEWRFRSHVLSEETLKKDIQDALAQLKDDLAANRNRLLSEIKLSLRTSECPVQFSDGQADAFLNSVTSRMSELVASTPKDTVVNGLTSLICQIVATEVAEQITVRIITGIAAAMASDVAIDTAVVGGATAAGAGAGGGGGSLAGPVGTAAGLIVALGIGFAVDWWVSGILEADLEQRCNKYLYDLEGEIVLGGAKSKGIRNAFDEAADIAHQTQCQSLHECLVRSESK